MKHGPKSPSPIPLVRERSTVQSCPAAPVIPTNKGFFGSTLPCPPRGGGEQTEKLSFRLGENAGTLFSERSEDFPPADFQTRRLARLYALSIETAGTIAQLAFGSGQR